MIQDGEKGANIKLILHITYIGSEKLSSYPSLCYGKVSKMILVMLVCLTPSTYAMLTFLKNKTNQKYFTVKINPSLMI